jgi:hypothetical protein
MMPNLKRLIASLILFVLATLILGLEEKDGWEGTPETTDTSLKVLSTLSPSPALSQQTHTNLFNAYLCGKL